jgi:2-isopropylmalate synthase/UPF0716 protein FxsA
MKYFLIYLFIETVVSVQFSSILGGLMTFFEFIATALIGMIILKNLNYSASENIKKVYQGEISEHDFTKMHISSLIGAILLIVPGFFTDIVGIILQFEGFALPFIRKFVKPKKTTSYHKTSFGTDGVNYKSYSYTYTEEKHNPKANNSQEEIIDVEIIENIEHNQSDTKH